MSNYTSKLHAKQKHGKKIIILDKCAVDGEKNSNTRKNGVGQAGGEGGINSVFKAGRISRPGHLSMDNS
jgi:hypothetical protein